MKVEIIAECSPWGILQYFWPALSDNWSWKPAFGLFYSGRFRKVLLYNKRFWSPLSFLFICIYTIYTYILICLDMQTMDLLTLWAANTLPDYLKGRIPTVLQICRNITLGAREIYVTGLKLTNRLKVQFILSVSIAYSARWFQSSYLKISFPGMKRFFLQRALGKIATEYSKKHRWKTRWFVHRPTPSHPPPPPQKKKKKKLQSQKIFVKTVVFFHQNINEISFYKFSMVHYDYLIERYLCAMALSAFTRHHWQGLPVGFLLLRYSVLFTDESLSLLYLLFISWFICSRRWCIDKLGVFNANIPSMFLDPHLNYGREIGLSPPVKYFYWPFQGGASFVDHFCNTVPRWCFFCRSFFCLVFVMLSCASVYPCLVVTCWERADLLALVCDVSSWSCPFLIGILGQVWCLIVSIIDLCPFCYFIPWLSIHQSNIWSSCTLRHIYFQRK